jgi:hypothetical protein
MLSSPIFPGSHDSRSPAIPFISSTLNPPLSPFRFRQSALGALTAKVTTDRLRQSTIDIDSQHRQSTGQSCCRSGS